MPEDIQLPSLPDVKIVDQNGKRLDTSAIDNYDQFMAFLMQASVAANTAKIRKYYDDRRSKGRIQSFLLNVTPTHQGATCIYPSQSIHVINDGPGSIFLTLNSYNRTPAYLLINDEFDHNFETHELKKFFVWSAPGTIATVRAWVTY